MRLLLIGLLVLLLSSGRLLAQPPPAALTPAQARTALEVLNDPKKRAEVVATLEAIAKAQPAPAPAAAAPAVAAPKGTPPAGAKPAAAAPAQAPEASAPIALAPDSLGAQVLLHGETLVSHLSADATNALHAMQSLPLLWAWLVVMATNPFARGILLDVAWRLAVALACGLAVQFALHRLLRRPVARLEAPPRRPAEAIAVNEPSAAIVAVPPEADDLLESDHPPAPADQAENPDLLAAGVTTPGPVPAADAAIERAEAGETEPPPRRRVSATAMLRRLPLVLARLVLDLIPVLGFTLAGHLVTGSTVGGATSTRVILLAVVDAYAVCAATLCIASMLLSPHAPRLRLFHLPDSLAGYLMRWIRRLVVIAVFGYAIAEVGLLLGLSEVSHRALLKANGFALHVCLAIMVLQKRRAVRRWLRAPAESTGTAARLRNALAYTWHWIALFFIVVTWLVWAVEIPNGFSRAVHFSLLIGLLLIGARLLLIVLDGALDRALRVPPETAERYPGLQDRLRLYHPGLSVLLRFVVYLLCLLGLLQLYGANSFGWFVESDLGNRIVSACGTMVVTLLLALAAWEAANAAIQRHLAKLAKEQQLARSTRLQTLLPLLRSALAIAILVFAGLTVLSEIGINIAPLLAGAGIIGVAIGFGSQKLVQDLITGVFLLLENAMQVGEFVTVSGLSGKVEALSVRTIRLRAGDGSVHIVPFSSVTTVTNVNRGLGNAPVSVTVEYAEDTDRVAATLTEIIAGMRGEADFAGKMLSDFQLWGVDKVDGAMATVVGQVVCTDSGRWSVQREFNRRMKQRFQELGIRLYNPSQSVAVVLPPAAAPPAQGGKDLLSAPAGEDEAHERARAAD